MGHGLRAGGRATGRSPRWRPPRRTACRTAAGPGTRSPAGCRSRRRPEHAPFRRPGHDLGRRAHVGVREAAGGGATAAAESPRTVATKSGSAPRGPDVRLGPRGAVVDRVHLSRAGCSSPNAPGASASSRTACSRRSRSRSSKTWRRRARAASWASRSRRTTRRSRFVYLAYAYDSPDGPRVRVSRFRDDGASLSGRTVIIEGIPAARNHAGCRIRFGPDGKLYVTTGDATDRKIAQDLKSLGGKTLRLNPDGSIPADNPFPGSPVFSYGHRNAQGIDWDPRTGLQYQTEHGPSGFDGPGGGDEVNLVETGKNYGWPVVHHRESAAGMVSPLLEYTPAVAPAGRVLLDREGSALVPGRFLLRQPSRRGSHPRAVRSEEPPAGPRDGGALSERSTAACATSSSAPTGRSTSPRATATAADAPARATIAFFGLSKSFPCIRLAASQWNLRRWSDSSPSCGASRCARWAENRPTSAWSRARAWPATGSTTSSTRSRARC